MTAQRIIDTMYTHSPLVFGHRGAKAYAPMNTIPSFELAAQQGAHGIELDVQLTQDGHCILMHDYTIDATTSGSGFVREMTLSELQALDAGSWFGPQFADTRIPTLDEVFEAVGTQLLVNVEIKAETAETDGIEAAVVACIKRHNMQQRVLLSSFNPPTLLRFRALLPEVPIGYLYEGTDTTLPDDAAYETYHPHYELVSANLVVQCRQRQTYLNVWTVNDPAHAVELARMGVHGIITDNPDTVLNALRQAGVST